MPVFGMPRPVPVTNNGFLWKTDSGNSLQAPISKTQSNMTSTGSSNTGTKSASSSPMPDEVKRDFDQRCNSTPSGSHMLKKSTGYEFSFKPINKQQEEAEGKVASDSEKDSGIYIPASTQTSPEKLDATLRQEVKDGGTYTSTDYRYIVQYLLDNMHSPKLSREEVLDIRSLLTLYRLRNELFSSETAHLQSRLRFYFVFLQYNLQVAVADSKEQELRNVGIVLSEACLKEMTLKQEDQRMA